ncbi:MAG: GNAT family N-acetyltransferase [Candidatus Thorarchaeota archaeon]|nr:GNAT family N-acetyltransferase [Candidatus Thorarchaeota archaeon]
MTQMRIRNMNTNDLGFAISLTEQEKWGSIREDFQELLLFDPNGSFIAEMNGEPIGMVCAISYGSFGFIGNLIVRSEYRKSGYGTTLMSHAIAYLKGKGTDTVMLDAVQKAVPLYKKLGFKEMCNSLRYEGRVEPETSSNSRDMEDKDMMHILGIDRKHFGANRFLFLGSSLSRDPDLARVIEVGGRIVGYIMGSKRHGFVRLAPWIISECPELANEMLRDFAVRVEGKQIKLGVLESNTHAVKVMKAHAFYQKSYSVRMVLGALPRDMQPSNAVYAIGSAMRG